MNIINKSRTIFYSRKIGQLSIAGLLFILPFKGITTLQEILFFLAICAFVVKKIATYRNNSLMLPFPNKPLDILIIISFIWGIITLFNAIDPLYSLYELIDKMAKQYILFFLSFYIIKEIAPDNGKIKWLLFPVALATLIMSLYACYQFYQTPMFFENIFENRVSGFTGEFYRLSVFLVLSIPIVIALAFNFNGWLRWMLILSLPIAIAALFFTFTRAAWIAVAIELSILTVIFFRQYRKSFFIGLAAMSLIFAIFVNKSIIPHKFVIHGSEKPRIEALKLSMEIISKNPFAGIGYGKKTFSLYYPEIIEPSHAHNIFLNTTVEVGIPGLIIFIAILTIIIKTFINALKKEIIYDRKLLLSGIFASIIGFLSLNLFDYMYHGWPGQMFWILVGFGFALIKPVSKANILSQKVND